MAPWLKPADRPGCFKKLNTAGGDREKHPEFGLIRACPLQCRYTPVQDRVSTVHCNTGLVGSIPCSVDKRGVTGQSIPVCTGGHRDTTLVTMIFRHKSPGLSRYTGYFTPGDTGTRTETVRMGLKWYTKMVQSFL